MFKAASGARPQRVDILAEEADDVVALTPPAPQMPVEEEKQPSVPAAADERLSAGEDALFESKPVIVKKVSEAEGDVLRYLDEPEEISGEAQGLQRQRNGSGRYLRVPLRRLFQPAQRKRR